ncbi:MAG: hypothetical protein AAB956_01760, partial [Patescibacteria group bacterium]
LTLYNNQSKRFFPRGEKVFYGYNIGSNNTINITGLFVEPQGTMLNVTIGRQSAGGFIYDGAEYRFNSSDIFVSTPNNFTIKAIFYSDSNQYLTPVLNETFSIVSYLKSTCGYSSGNWNINRADNCIITSNVAGTSGTNMTVSGTGNFTLNTVNISGFNDYIFKKDCTGSCEDFVMTNARFG